MYSVYNIIFVLCTILVAINAKCVEIIDYSVTAEFTGMRRSQCAGILPYDYIWVDESLYSTTENSTSPTCQQESQFLLDNQINRVSSLFNSSSPSKYCQQTYVAIMCYMLYPQCDPTTDTDENTFVPSKPCEYLCDLLTNSDESNGICTSSDINELKTTFGLLTQFPQLSSCKDTQYWSSDTSTCVAPATIPSYLPTARCESYSGSFCSGIFSDSFQVYLEPWASQTDIETFLATRTYEFNLLPQDSMCTQSLLAMWCQESYPECFNVQGSPVAETIDTSTNTALSSTHRIPLYPPKSICEDVNSYCAGTNYFILRYNNSIDCDAVTRNTTTCDISPNAHGINTYASIEGMSDKQHTSQNFKPSQLLSKHQSTSSASSATSTSTSLPLSDNNSNTTSTDALVTSTQQHAVTSTVTYDQPITVPTVSNNQVGIPVFYDSTDYAILYWQTTSNTKYIQATTFSASQNLQVTYIPYTVCPGRLVTATGFTQSTSLVSNFPTYTLNGKSIYGGRCAVPCPPPAYSATEYPLMERSAEIAEGIVIPLGLALCITFIIFRSQRSKYIVFWFTMTYVAMLIMLLVGTSVVSAHPFITCGGPTVQAQMKGFGLWQSMFLIYFTLCTCNWWLMQAVDIFEKLILGRTLHRGSPEWHRHSIVMHLFCWITPAISVIALIVGSQLGYNGYMSYAWVAFDQHMTSDPINLEWAFVFVPLLAVLIIALGLSGVVVYALFNYNHTKGIRKFHAQLESNDSLWTKIQAISRLMGYLFVMVFFIAVLIGIRVHTFVGLPVWHRALDRWGRCLVAEGTDCRIEARLTPQLVALMNVTFSIPGLIMFLLYFGRSELWRLWCGLFYFQLGIPCFERCADRDTVDTGSTTNNSRTTTDFLTGATVAAPVHTESTAGSQYGELKSPQPTLNNNSSANNASLTVNNRSNANLLSNNDSTMVSSSVTRTAKQKAAQRQALFKGFKSTKGFNSTTTASYAYTGESVSRLPISSTISNDSHGDNFDAGPSPAFQPKQPTTIHSTTGIPSSSIATMGLTTSAAPMPPQFSLDGDLSQHNGGALTKAISFDVHQ